VPAVYLRDRAPTIGPCHVTTPPGPARRVGLRARHARRVTPEHVGERVSLRRWVDDPDRGPVQSDVVGRLLAFDDELLLLVDRRHRLHVVEAGRVLSSRVVPPHPRMEDEPGLPTRDAPLEREAARVLLLDAADRVLLVAHLPGGRRVWTAPGGGLEPDEDHRAAARRELDEELGLEADPGPWVWSRTVTFPFRGVWLRQRERWYLVRADVDATEAPLIDAGTDEARWWTLEELDATDEVLAPRRLTEHLTALLAEGPPDEPADVGT
jgi:8-oxo-dGTP pyrophosphatase MutT (NUDIX family)